MLHASILILNLVYSTPSVYIDNAILMMTKGKKNYFVMFMIGMIL